MPVSVPPGRGHRNGDTGAAVPAEHIQHTTDVLLGLAATELGDAARAWAGTR